MGSDIHWLGRDGQKIKERGRDRLATRGDGTRHGARRWSEEGAALVRLIKLMRSGGSGGYLGGGKGKEERGREGEEKTRRGKEVREDDARTRGDRRRGNGGKEKVDGER